MRSLTVLAVALAAALPVSSIAQQKQPPQPQVSGAIATAPGKAAAVAYTNVTATVEAVDAATRTVSLKGPKGNVVDVVAGAEVRNFDQIKKGDKLTVKYAEALTLELKKDGKAVGRSEAEGLKRSKPGEKPGGAAVREVTVVADVVGVDAAAKKVSLKGPKGNVVDLNVRDPEQLKLIKMGDKVEATYTQALAISMEAPAAPAKAPEKKK
jgi:Cu/Ag efflux protein CusF